MNDLLTRQAEWVELFNSLPSWQEKFQFLIDTGEPLRTSAEQFCVEAHRIDTCASRTYFSASVVDERVRVRGSSNAAVPSGIIAVFIKLFDGTPVAELQDAADAGAVNFHVATGLLDNLTETRRLSVIEMHRRLLAVSRHREECSDVAI